VKKPNSLKDKAVTLILSANETRMHERFNLRKSQLNCTQSFMKLGCNRGAMVIQQH
jgi:hypothetical protein